MLTLHTMRASNHHVQLKKLHDTLMSHRAKYDANEIVATIIVAITWNDEGVGGQVPVHATVKDDDAEWGGGGQSVTGVKGTGFK